MVGQKGGLLQAENSDVLNATLTGFVVGANTPVTSSDTVLSAFEVTQGQINAITGGSSIFVKRDGTTALTADWAAGAFKISSASVGVNTGSTALASVFHVVNTSTSTIRGIINDQYSASTDSAKIYNRKARGTFASPTTIITGDVLGNWTSSGYDGTSFVDVADMRVVSTGTISTGIIPSQIMFRTMTTGGSLTTALTINESQTATFAASIVGNTDLTVATIYGSSSASGTLSLNSTSNATKGQITFGTMAAFNGTSGFWRLGSTTTPIAQVQMSGNISASNWGISGIGLVSDSSRTFTNTTSSGTVATLYIHAINSPTIAASSSSTFTLPSTLYVGAPIQGSLVTNSNPAALTLGGALYFNGAGTVKLGTFDSAGVNICTANATRIAIASGGGITLSDGINFTFNATTGTKIGTATTEKLAFWNKTPIVQPTTGITGATRVGGAGTTVTTTDTYGGYTIAQLAAIIINTGLTA